MRSIILYFYLSFCFLALIVPAQAQTPRPTPSGAEPFDFYRRAPYRANVPRPSAILGYEIGERHSTYREQERVILAIAEAARDRVRIIEFGKSVEGRPLRLVIVTSPENMGRLDAIREANLKLADPRKLTAPGDAENIIRTAPVLTWISHTIHGDESASFETAMWTLYTLAASEAPEITDALAKSVVILNPVFNPDGHERFVVWYSSVALGLPEYWAYEQNQPWAIRGRYNHYRFDMNRDKLVQSQLETKQETAAFLQWYPQVFVDQHGQPPTYFFPPNALPSNANVDRERVNRWTDIFGRANARAFDSYGWAYINRETFDFFAPVYLDSFTTLVGSIGMTYETDGGGNLARKRDDGTIGTLRDAAAHHMEAALSTIVTAAANREALLKDFYTFRAKALNTEKEKVRRIVIVPRSDPNRASELATLLTRSGVEVREVTAEFESGKVHSFADGPKVGAKKQKFSAGTLIINMAQPQGAVARAFLEPDANFEPDFIKAQLERRKRNEQKNDREPREGYEFYDISAWSLPMTFGVEAYWTEDAGTVNNNLLIINPTGTVRISAQTGGVHGGRADVAYLFKYERDNAAILALRLLQEGYRLQGVIKPVSVAKEEWPRGTIIVRVDRNPDTLHSRIAELAESLGVEVQAVSSTYVDGSGVGIGSEYNIVTLSRPRIAVVADDSVSLSSYGSVWYQLEQAGIAFTPVRLGNLRGTSLARFNIIILPEGGGYWGAFGKDGVSELKDWMGRGGVLMGLGSGGLWFMEKDADLTSARPVGDGEDEKQDENKDNKDSKSPPKKPVELAGSIFAAKLSPDHFLSFGYPTEEILVPLGGDTFLKPSKTGTNVITFGKGPNVRSGFIWPNNTEELLTGTAYVIDERIGAGHALLYLNDPTFRAYWPGLRKLFFSGILFGPSGNE